MAYWQDDTFDTWPEVYKAGTAAIGLYSRCGAYCARELTDGLIPAELAASYGTREWVQKLVEVGLWEIEATGYRDVYFLVGKKGNKLNPTREEALKKLKDAADRTARWRANANAKKKGVTRHVQGSDASRDGIRDSSSDASPSLPPPKGGKGERPPASQGGARALPPDPPPPPLVDDVENPDWRRMPAFGTERDPAAAERSTARAAQIRASLRRPGRLELVRDPPAGLSALDDALAELPVSEEVSDADDHASA